MNNIKINGISYEFDFESSIIKSDYVLKSCDLHIRFLDNGDSTDAINKLTAEFNKPVHFMPEFLTERTAYADFCSQDIVITGCRDLLDEICSRFKDTVAGEDLEELPRFAIVGRPNAGKSSILNAFIGEERNIVTDIAGTTRDVVEDTVRLGNVVLHLADTAGIRETGNEVEKIGVDFAVGRVERASLVLAVFDLSREFDDEDKAVIELCKNKCAVAIINKDDLDPKFDKSQLDCFSHQVIISAKDGTGADKLAQAVENALGTDSIDTSAALLANERQRQCCEKAAECLREAIDALRMNMTLDAVTVSTEGAITELLTMTGEKANEAVVNEVFSRFCVGK